MLGKFAILLLATTMCSRTSQPDGQRAAQYTDPEAYAVYSAVLDDNFHRVPDLSRKVVIFQETEQEELCRDFNPRLHPTVAPAAKNYVSENSTKRLLIAAFEPGKNYELLTPAEFEDMFYSNPLESWNKFYRRFPGAGGLFRFSAVGFNEDKSIAVVHSSESCNWGCGAGNFQVLKKKNGKWLPLKGAGLSCEWIS